MTRHRPQRAPKPDPRAQLDPGPAYTRRTWPRHRREQQRAGIVPAATLGQCRALGLDPHELRTEFLAEAMVSDIDRRRTHADGWHLRDRVLSVALCWYVVGRLCEARRAAAR